ncbi:hypothetical protein, partial [Mesorhizobium sp. M1D.F.Ca.ET.234.01.1.1]|uniref:hypothetical protein n=2 Tax=Mesorhizobium TaxID=68287 RepID=UPI001FDF1F72
KETAMDHIVDSRQEAALQALAEAFIAEHKGDAMRALKEMIVLNGHLQERLDARSRRKAMGVPHSDAQAETQQHSS